MIELYLRFVGVHPLIPASENELRIPFADIDADPLLLPEDDENDPHSKEPKKVILALIFNPANRWLAAAHVCVPSSTSVGKMIRSFANWSLCPSSSAAM